MYEILKSHGVECKFGVGQRTTPVRSPYPDEIRLASTRDAVDDPDIPVLLDHESAYQTLTPGYRSFVVFGFVNQYDKYAPRDPLNVAAVMVSGSPYCHVQLLFPDSATTFTVDQTKGKCYKETDRCAYLSSSWDFVCVHTTPQQYELMLEYCESQLGAPYDSVGFWCTPFRWYLPCMSPFITLAERALSCMTSKPRTITSDGEELVRGMHTAGIVSEISEDCKNQKQVEYRRIPQTCARLAMLALANAGMLTTADVRTTSPAPSHIYDLLIRRVKGRHMHYDCKSNVDSYTWDLPKHEDRSPSNIWIKETIEQPDDDDEEETDAEPEDYYNPRVVRTARTVDASRSTLGSKPMGYALSSVDSFSDDDSV